jgi:hypothetical protein
LAAFRPPRNAKIIDVTAEITTIAKPNSMNQLSLENPRQMDIAMIKIGVIATK